MKLPQYVAEVPAPKTTGLGEYQPLPATFAQAIPRALAQVGQQAQQIAVSVGEELAQADRRRQQLEEATQTAALTTEAELELKQRAYDVSQGPDYNTYDADLRAGGKDILARTLAKTRNPNVKASVGLRLQKALGAELLDLQQIKQKRFADTQIANVDRTLKNLENLAALSTDPEQVGGYTGLGRGLIQVLASGGTFTDPTTGEQVTLPGNLITQQEAVKRTEKFLEGTSSIKARQDIERNPEAFLANVDKYINLDPTKRQSLVEHARKEVEFRATKAEREQRQHEATERRQLKEWQSENSKQLMLQIKQGQANMGTVMQMASAGQLDENDTRFYLNYFDTQARRADAAADRAQREKERLDRKAEHLEDRADRTTFGSFRTQLYSGEMDPEQLMEVAKSGKYNDRISGELAKFAFEQKAQGQQSVNAETTELRRQFNRMEEETKAEFLGIASGDNPRITEEAEQLWAQFQTHARTRSKAWSTAEDAIADPWAVKREIIDEYKDRLRGIVTRGAAVGRMLIPERYRPLENERGEVDFQSIQVMKGKLRDDVLTKRITESEARIQAGRLRDLERGVAARDREDNARASAAYGKPPAAKKR
jgi:hypothetical protein